MKNWGIRSRVTMLAVGPAVLLACVLAIYFTFSRITDAEDALYKLGESTAHHLASSAEYGVVTGNRNLLQGLVDAAIRNGPTQYALISDGSKLPLAAAGTTKSASRSAAWPGNAMAARSDYVFSAPILLRKMEMRDTFAIDGGGQEETGKPIGWATVIMSRTLLDEDRNRMLATAFFIVAAGILATALLAAKLGASVSDPVRELSNSVGKMARGQLDVRVVPSAGGELGVLQSGFNRMSEALHAHQEELKQRITEATAGLEEKKEEAERANHAKSSFLAAVSHDLRQPMHAVGLFAAALRERVDTPEQQELVQRIEDSVSALQIMFDSLLNFSRLDAGAVEASMQACDLKAILNRVWKDHQPVAAQKHLNFRVRMRPAWGVSDPLLLARLVGNLVANAVRYTEQGGIVVGCRRRGQHWVIEVWDSGIGIPAEHLPHVFEAYYQVGNEERNRSRGVGLGLAIVHKIAEVLGHEVSVRSWKGKGSVFSVSIAATEAQHVERRLGGQRDVGLFSGERVLVIDDDADARDALSRLLEGWGMHPVAADGAENALEQLGSGEVLPCLIVCDYRLPGTTGIDLIRELRAKAGKELPALIMTGDTSATSMAALQASALSVLHKPVRPAKLRALIAALLSPHTES